MLDPVTLIVAGLIFGVVAYIALLPILSGYTAETPTEITSVETLEHQQTRFDQLITSIRDLDFDYDTGKVSTEVYAEQRKLLIGRAVSALIQLDRIESKLAELDADLEAEIQAYRKVSTAS